MPTEARNFRDVDKEWKTIMHVTVKDPMVITATDYPNLLKKLKNNNALLEDIQKGLNDYLEKKRLFFPRLVSFHINIALWRRKDNNLLHSSVIGLPKSS